MGWFFVSRSMGFAEASTNRPNSVMSQGASSSSPFGRLWIRDQFPAQLAAVSSTITPHASQTPSRRTSVSSGAGPPTYPAAEPAPAQATGA